MSRQQATVILDAAERWKQRCLLEGGSLFTDERLWTRDRFEQLRVHVVEHANRGSDSFWKRLRRLLDPAPPAAKRLWAEMTWAFYLIANLSRIFGELLMLIEPDKRGPGHAIPLTYSGAEERFFVPDNVHVLGMMNTADRSLAMVDYALRRRFAFELLKPAYGTEEFREYLLKAEVDRALVDRIETSLKELNARISEEKDLGPGFQIGHSFFVPDDQTESADEGWYESVVETQIAPLLREYWFDRPERAEELVELLRR